MIIRKLDEPTHADPVETQGQTHNGVIWLDDYMDSGATYRHVSKVLKARNVPLRVAAFWSGWPNSEERRIIQSSTHISYLEEFNP